MTQMLDSHHIHQHYTNPLFCNVLQIMTDKSSKGELNDMKTKSELKGKKAKNLLCLPKRRLTFA